MKITKVLHVTWRDSACGSRWDLESNLTEVSVCQSVGFVIKETPKALYLCGDLDDEVSTSRRMTIPKECIIKRRVLSAKTT